MIEWHLLGKREHAFKTITALLDEHCVIVETGTIRTLGNWTGDGQSTIVWNEYAKQLNGQVWTIDIEIAGAQLVEQLQLSHTIAVTGDSLDMIPKLKLEHIDLLYLDSFDIDWSNPEPSAQHHLDELNEAMHMLSTGSIVAVDDNMAVAGKGMKVAAHMKSIDAEPLVDGYVQAWRL
jgi:hypothetical protein